MTWCNRSLAALAAATLVAPATFANVEFGVAFPLLDAADFDTQNSGLNTSPGLEVRRASGVDIRTVLEVEVPDVGPFLDFVGFSFESGVIGRGGFSIGGQEFGPELSIGIDEGDGIADEFDALFIGTTDPVGVSDPILNFDPLSVPLDATPIKALIDGGATQLAVNLRVNTPSTSVTLPSPTGPSSSPVPAIVGRVRVADSGTLSVHPSADAEGEFNESLDGFVIQDGSSPIVVSNQSSTPERRGLLEFDLSDLPPAFAIEVEEAVLTLDVSLFTSSGLTGQPPTTFPEITVFGYNGNGEIEPVDPEQAEFFDVALGEFTVTDLGLIEIELDPAIVELFAGRSGIQLGLSLVALDNGQFFSFYPSETLFAGSPPKLDVSFRAIPEPAAASLIALGLGVFVLRRHRASRCR